MASLEESRRAARAAGMSEEGLTPEVLRLYGWEPGNPLAGVVLSPSPVTEEQLNDQLALLLAEAKANSVPNQVISGIMSVVGMAMKFVK